ncbi:Uncharacterized protein dnm_094530 [Desulfonema magnum]|uniref:Uncharacterized protein n=1 Tax=Desulfonema magnum TaxID=45655 RepID=A0A975BXU9_9BACT|nr:Uncharacterized protein dnm_094530 [Desulfonema magnum]
MIKFFSVIPAKAGIHGSRNRGIGPERIPAFAGMTGFPSGLYQKNLIIE